MFWDHIYKPNTPLKWWNWLQELRILVVGLVFWEGQIKKHTITNNYIDSGRTLPSGILNRTFMKRCQTENVCVLCLFKGNYRIIKHCFLSISLEWCWSPPGLCSGTCLVSPMSHYDHPAFWSFSPSTTVERNVWKSVLSRAPSSSRFTFSKGFWSEGWWVQWPYTTWWKVKTSNMIWWKLTSNWGILLNLCDSWAPLHYHI